MKRLAIFLFSLLVISESQAASIPIEPDNYAENTDLTNVYPGVTLSVDGRPDATVVSINGYDAFNDRNLATTGSLVFGYTPVIAHATGEGKVWDENEYGLLRADFSAATNFVSVDLIYDDDDAGVIYALDSSDNLLASVTAQGDGRGSASPFCPPYCDPFSTVSISRDRCDISYILVGGINSEALFLDNLQYNYVPLQDRYF